MTFLLLFFLSLFFKLCLLTLPLSDHLPLKSYNFCHLPITFAISLDPSRSKLFDTDKESADGKKASIELAVYPTCTSVVC